MNFANFASFAISISVKFANFASGWCESDVFLWCMLLLISSFPQITLIARIFSLRDVYGLQSTVTIRIYFSRSFFLPQMTQISLIFYHLDFTIFALLLRKKRSMDDTDSYSLRSLFFFRQNDRRTFFSLDIRLAMPLAYLSEKKTGWLRPAVVFTVKNS